MYEDDIKIQDVPKGIIHNLHYIELSLQSLGGWDPRLTDWKAE